MKVQPYNLHPSFERAVVFYTCTQQHFYGRIGHAVEPPALTSEIAKQALEAVQAIALDLGHGPGSSVLVVQRLHRWMHEGRVTLEQVQAVDDYLAEGEDDQMRPSLEAVIKELVPIIQRRQQYETIVAAQKEYTQRGDFKQVMDSIARLSQLGIADNSEGTDLAQGSALIAAMGNVDYLPTGILDLDYGLGGGMARGQLGVVVGGPGDGKSMFLNHVACLAAANGLFVLYATLELPEPIIHARIQSNLSGKGITPILQGAASGVDFSKLGPFKVKQFTAQATTVEDIKQWVYRCEESTGRVVDLLVVDYADKMIGAKKEEHSYTAMRDVYEGLRLFTEQGKFWTWTASQAKGNTHQDKKQKKDVNHMADSMHKGRVADLVITLNARGEQAEEMMFYVGKNRTGNSRFTVGPMPTDFANGKMVMV